MTTIDHAKKAEHTEILSEVRRDEFMCDGKAVPEEITSCWNFFVEVYLRSRAQRTK